MRLQYWMKQLLMTVEFCDRTDPKEPGNVATVISNLSNIYYHLEYMDNHVKTKGDNYMLKHTCTHCGCVLEAGDALIFEEEVYCVDCLDELTVLCDNCGRRIFRESCESDGHITICSDCYSRDYVACTRCGRLMIPENACYEDDDEDVPYCAACYQSLNWIHHYNYKPEPVFYGAGHRYFGVELEVDDGGEIQENAKRVVEFAPAQIYCKHDGSIESGFEGVSHPMTLEYHCTVMPWEKIVNTLKSMGYRSHQTSTCGLHIHVNRTSLGYTYDAQDEVIARILFLVEKFWHELVKFSRRTLGQLDRWAARYGYQDCPKEILKTAKGGYGRYACVNLCNENTIEFRIFRGTLKYNTLIAALQLVNRVCDAAVFMTDEEVKELSWSGFVTEVNEPELIQYLKERSLYIVEKEV